MLMLDVYGILEINNRDTFEARKLWTAVCPHFAESGLNYWFKDPNK